jgi:hypothetical protein
LKRLLVLLLLLCGVALVSFAQTTDLVIETADGNIADLYRVTMGASGGYGSIYGGDLVGFAPGTLVVDNGFHFFTGGWPYDCRMKINAQGGTQYWTLHPFRIPRMIVGVLVASSGPLTAMSLFSAVDNPGAYATVSIIGIAAGLATILTSLPRARLESVVY